MNQIQEKIKDLVEVRSNSQLDDFLADLGQTLGGYYFTDITSDLMAKWIDRVVVMPTGSGNAYALAGYRGVGKSHFLAAFGAILSQPDLRSKLKDSHVFASAERLIRRHYPIINVLRGTKETLIDEFRTAVAKTFEIDVSEISTSAAEIVKFASERGGAGPSILIIDTDIERETRVSRDDGAILSEIAKAAEGTNLFIAVALDDDVATADGRNSGISTAFTIDYLDHEHLYKIIDANIFPKNNQKRAVITAIYDNFRKVLPSFRWSEQRMSSVYPLHPVILEIAPFVRLFIQDFALLAFASQEGSKILNRQADSLIAPDELFDTVESSLREAGGLEDVFETYDALNESVIGKAPVMERLRAKLVLKGLLLLSLDSEGATASDIAAAMIIFDDRDPKSATLLVENLLEKFVAASAGRLWRMDREGRAVKYGFNLSGKEHFNTALSEAVQSVPDSVIPELLKRLMRDRFSDCQFTISEDGREVADTELEWRGGVRRGRLIWNIGYRENQKRSETGHPVDWEILLDFGSHHAGSSLPLIKWKPDELKPEEFETLKRYHALMSREDLQQTFRDEVRATIQTYTIAIEKIWERKFLQYGVLLIDGVEHHFSSGALSGHNLSEVLGLMLTTYLEQQFPEHPIFSSRLEMESVDELSRGLFAARESVSPEVRKLAEAFAVPLGLADGVAGNIEVAPVESLLGLRPVTELMELLATTDGPVGIETLEARLGARPFGLTFEAQSLVLTALVARGVIEFVTNNGDRIGSRSLDLKLVWEDVAGVAIPGKSTESDDKLASWAALLTGNGKIKSISSETDRSLVKDSLSKWLSSWSELKLLERLDAVPDDTMTTEIWHLGAHIRKSYGAAADAVAAYTVQTSDLENALRRVREAFSNSAAELETRAADINALESLLTVAPLRKQVLSSIVFYEPTTESDLERSRTEISQKVWQRLSVTSGSISNDLASDWANFRSSYNEFILSQHAASARFHDIKDRANEILDSHVWWVYENLCDVDQFPTRFRRITREILREIRKCNCTSSVVQNDTSPAYCPTCGFSVHTDRVRNILCIKLWETINQAIVAYDHVLGRIQEEVLDAGAAFGASISDESVAESALAMCDKLKNGVSVADFTENEMRVLIVVLRRMAIGLEAHHELEEAIDPVITGEEIVEDVVVVN